MFNNPFSNNSQQDLSDYQTVADAIAWAGTSQSTLGFTAGGNISVGTDGNVLSFTSNNYGTYGTARFGSDTAYTDYEIDGQRRAYGNAVVWEDIIMPLAGTPTAPGKVPVLAAYGTAGLIQVRTLANDTGASIDEMHFAIEFPHNWTENSLVYPHLHWVPMAETAGTVVFQLNYAISDMRSLTLTENTLEFHGTTDGSDKWRHKFANSTAPLDLTGYHIGANMACRLFRDGNHATDDLAATVGVLTLGIHYPVDSDGSREIATK
jgi:hypothetical protein